MSNKRAAYNKKWWTENKDKAKQYRQVQKDARLKYWREVTYPKHKDAIKQRVKENMRFRKYGITKERFDALLIAQDYRCRVCRTDDPGSHDWNVDHDHVTNKVRGLLCANCNFGLGHFKDNPETLRAAAVYLEFYKIQ